MMRFILVITGFLVISVAASAQQIEQFTQQSFGHFQFNPAATGKYKDGMVMFKYRKQWAGAFNGQEPSTQILRYQTRVPKFKNVGLGASIINDKTGPTSRTALELSYAYRLKFKENGSNLCFGLSGVLMQYRIDFDQLTTLEDDPTLPGAVADNNKIGGDLNAGVYVYDKKYFLGLSVANLFKNNLIFNNDTVGIQLARHYYVIAGYEYNLVDKLELEPSILIKMVEAAPAQFDLNLRLIYDKDYWVGLNYRTSDAISIYAGFSYKKQWHIGYGYDISISDIPGGSHELLLAYSFGKNGKLKIPSSPN